MSPSIVVLNVPDSSLLKETFSVQKFPNIFLFTLLSYVLLIFTLHAFLSFYNCPLQTE